MSRFSRLCLTFVVPGGVLVFLAIALAGLSACSPAATDEPPQHTTQSFGSCRDGDQDSGAKYRICMPTFLPWNGDLVVYAHGYVAYNAPVTIPENQLVVGGVSLPDIFNMQGYAFATTSYSTNGLAVREGIADLTDLVHVFTTTQGATPTHIYLGGASEGGLITALAIEKHPDVFDGGLAACGPVGGIRKQIDYYGDVRIVFDYFFPGLLPGEPVTVPQSLIDGWDAHYATVVSPTINDPANAYSLTQLLAVTGAAYEAGNPATMVTTTSGLLWYTVFATNDGKAKLGGQPFDNWDRVYTGSDNDLLLNQQVQRFKADQSALDEMQAHYRLTGWLTVPLVTLHTTLDEIVPYWHVPIYQAMVKANNRTPWYEHISVPRYGHCNFKSPELLQAFTQLVYMVENQDPDLSASRKRVVDASGDGIAQPGEVLTYTITLTNGGRSSAGVVLTDSLPVGLTYVPGSLGYDFPGAGFTATFSHGVLTAHTQGYLAPPEGSSFDAAGAATITFAAQVSDRLPSGIYILNSIKLADQSRSYAIPPAAMRIRHQVFLPAVFGGYETGGQGTVAAHK
jgi:uncharacterized repeat protein (TIGR01451 family)